MRPNYILSSVLQRSPALHSAVKQFRTKRLLMKEARRHSTGFRFLGPEAMQDGTFEPDETAQITELLRDVDVFVNVGANVGYYICLARQLGKPCVAIEPLDRNVQHLKSNLAINGWMDVEVLPVGLGESEGLQRIYGGGTAASLVPGWAGASTETYDLVPVTTLDNVLGDRFDDQRLLILIDVEGFELKVLRAAQRQLSRSIAPVWFVEVCLAEHQPEGQSLNPDIAAVFELFWSEGYMAAKAGCETGEVSEGDVRAWSRGENLPGTHNFVFHKTPQTIARKGGR